MQKTKTKIMTALLLAALTLAIFPLAAYASTGQILVNPTVSPMASQATTVPAGGNVNLYLGNVVWSGGQFYLLFSTDGFSQVSTTDLRYTPTISVAAVQSSTVTTISNNPSFPGTWTIGDKWINGSIPTEVAGGNYFIKAFDGAVTFLAVTDITITVDAAFTVTPVSGAGGTSLVLKGYAFPANALVNLTYFNPITAKHILINNLTQANELGQFTYTIAAPDLKQADALPGDMAIVSNGITFRATNNATGAFKEATYTEYQRGLLQFGQPKATGITGSIQNATAGNLFGNLTDFTGVVQVGVGATLRIAGNYFYPGAVTFKWDNSIDITPSAGVSANDTGAFNTTLTVPVTSTGVHNITIVDANNVAFAVYLYVIPSISLNPTSGPSGTIVTVTGYGFPASSGTTVVNASIQWGLVAKYVASVFTDSSGSFTTTFVVPASAGGQVTVTALQNVTGSFVSTATATFTVKASFSVTPSTFANNGNLLVVASGTGFVPNEYYIVNIDNVQIGINPIGSSYQTNLIANASGGISVTFIGTGFRPGEHVVSVYPEGPNTDAAAPAAWATFKVLNDGDPVIDAIISTNSTIQAKLVTISNDIVTIKTSTGTIQTSLTALDAKIVSVEGKVATISTNVGTIQASVSSLPGTISTSVQNGMATITTSIGTVNTKLDSIDAVLGAVAGDVVTLKTSVGDITTTLTAINAKVVSIEGDVATIQTDLGTLQGVVTQVKDGVATINTGVGTIQTSVAGLQEPVQNTDNNTAGMSTMIYVAVAFAIIAAIAAVASILLMRKKIAS